METRLIMQVKNFKILSHLNPNVKAINYIITNDADVMDWPIIYTSGGIAYDNPYRLPAYIKKAFTKYIQSL